ncbi:MAG: deoxycytidylate deaminase [Oscillospiraceae bacterium]
MRIDKDNYYLNIAKAVAARSTCLRRQYGAVIVADDEIIATGYNGAPRGEANCCDVGKCYCREHSTLSTSMRLAMETSTGPVSPFTPSRMRLSARRGGQCEVLPFTLHASMNH